MTRDDFSQATKDTTLDDFHMRADRDRSWTDWATAQCPLRQQQCQSEAAI
jgi:hypothetical protein